MIQTTPAILLVALLAILHVSTAPSFAEKNFEGSALVVDYVQWGEAEHFRKNVASEADIFPQGQFVPAPNSGQSLSSIGTGNTPEAWISTTPTIGSENSTQ